MTADPQKTPEDTPTAQDLVRSMQRVGDHLLAGMDADSRVQSGVPSDHLASDLDFIQMTGLTRPDAPQEDPADVAPHEDPSDVAPPAYPQPDPHEPLSFYEKGVADVDTALTPQLRDGIDDAPNLDLLSVSATSRPRDTYSIDELKQIINELSQGEPTADRRASYEAPQSISPLAASAATAAGPSESPETLVADAEMAPEASFGADRGPDAHSVLLTKTDSLAELLERELAGQPVSAAQGPEVADAAETPEVASAPEPSEVLATESTSTLEIDAPVEDVGMAEDAPSLVVAELPTEELHPPLEPTEALAAEPPGEPITEPIGELAVAESAAEVVIGEPEAEPEPAVESSSVFDDAEALDSALLALETHDYSQDAVDAILADDAGLNLDSLADELCIDEPVAADALAIQLPELTQPVSLEPAVTADTAPTPEVVAPTVDAPTVDAPTVDAPLAGKPYSHDLAEVELLLRTLQEQPRDVPTPPVSSIAAPASALRIPESAISETVDDAAPAEGFGQEKDESVYRRPQERRGRRKSRVHRRIRRRLIRLAALSGIVLIVFSVGYGAYRWSKRGLATAGKQLAEAAALVAKGRFSDAAADYADFVKRYANHPSRPDALFSAAYYLQVSPTEGADSDSGVTSAARLEQSLGLLQQFVDENPLHAKAARAKTLIGLLQHRLKRYKEAVDQLHSPGLRVEDPYASLIILRTLASSYARLGDFESARSAYLQAASLPDNYNPDRDYQELSELCKSMADQAATPEESRRYLEMSVEQLSHAIVTPGIDPVTKKRFQSLITARQTGEPALPNQGGAAAPAPKPGPASAPVPLAPAPVEAPPPAAPPTPQPAATTMNAEPDPRLEAAQLNAGAIKPAPAPADKKDGKP